MTVKHIIITLLAPAGLISGQLTGRLPMESTSAQACICFAVAGNGSPDTLRHELVPYADDNYPVKPLHRDEFNMLEEQPDQGLSRSEIRARAERGRKAAAIIEKRTCKEKRAARKAARQFRRDAHRL